MPPAPAPYSRFFEDLLAHNQPGLAGWQRWLLEPGMRFKSPETWWGEKKPRLTPHEGLDLYAFADAAGQIRYLDENIKIPATFAGRVVKMARDFLGQSIFLSHEILAPDGRQLYTAYGHTRPLAKLKAGQTVAAGEVIATLAAPQGKKPRIPGHLHITLAWIPLSLPADRLTWPNLGSDPGITLLDPWSILGDAE